MTVSLTTLPPKFKAALQAMRISEPDAIEEIAGGAISKVVRASARALPGGSVIIKVSEHVGPDVYAKEALGLGYLQLPGCPRVPRVLHQTPDWLILEDLGKPSPPTPKDWERLADSVFRLHAHVGPAHGFYYDNYLGNLPQENAWNPDGVEFFLEHRVRRFFAVGHCATLLAAEDRHRLDRFCERFRSQVPQNPPRLVHGDLWLNNIFFGAGREPACFDPAVYYGYPEADLSMMRMYGDVPQAFWKTYADLAGTTATDEWFRTIHWFDIKELLGVVAFFGEEYQSLTRLRGFLQEMTSV